MMNCKGICSNLLAKKPNIKDTGRYESGQKRCSNCEVFIICDKKNCPCCGCNLRSKPRNSQGRDKLVQSVMLKNKSK